MRMTKSERLFYMVNGFLLTLIAISCFFPLIHIVSLSLSSPEAIMSGKVSFFPKELTVESYHLLMKGTRVIGSMKNSILITVTGVLLSMSATILTAYPLSRRWLPGRRWFTLAAVFTMMFSAGIIPTFLVVHSVGLIDTYWALWLPGLVSTYNMLIMRSFFDNIPVEIDEAGRIDGCGEWRMLFRIFLPLSTPVLATLSLFYGVGFWNAFMGVLLYINDTAKYNMTVLVQQMIQSQSLLQEVTNSDDVAKVTPEGIKAAGIMVLILPMLAVYPFLQKYFVKGVMLGAVKG